MLHNLVIPAKAGIHATSPRTTAAKHLDPRLRGDDVLLGGGGVAS
jgi:hypothetical protein